MLQKFKMTTYATLLLIGVFVLPYMVEAVDRIENASNRFGCGDTYEELRDCMETVVSTRDASIDQLNAQLSSVGAELEKAIEELQAAVDKAEAEKVELQAGLLRGDKKKGPTAVHLSVVL